ncbi:hypothetical protein [Legionella sp. CNM-4043-24]|uniref:hypothetical protein n=1 Tax=Legionella sp. CNM-4043-24 TaxID=3421646 RepID=UPI00403AEDAA
MLKRLHTELQIDNLNLLDEHHFYEFNQGNNLEFSLYGLGGNFLASKKLFDRPIAGNGGKVWATLHQFGALYSNNVITHIIIPFDS